MNLDQVIDRSNTNAVKYRMLKANFGREDLLPLWIADMDLAVPPQAIEAVKARAEHGIFGYDAVGRDYKEAVCAWQERHYHWKLQPELLSSCPGIVPGFVTILDMLSEKGDEILIQPPVYHQFANVIREQERVVLNNPLIETESGYEIDFADFEAKLQRKPKLFMLCNPHNPVGKMYTKEELTRTGKLCIQYGVPMVSDEIHADLCLYGKQHIPIASISEELASNTITCFSIGKTFNMAGLQFASIYFAKPDMKRDFDRFWQKMHLAGPNTFAQAAATAAYTEGDAWLEEIKRYLEGNIAYVRDFLAAHIPQVRFHQPDATYLLWLDFRGLMGAEEDLQQFLTEEAKLALNAGATFGADYRHFARLNVATQRSVLEQAMQQLKAAVDRRG